MRKLKLIDFIPLYGLSNIPDIYDEKRWKLTIFTVWHTAWIMFGISLIADLTYFIVKTLFN